MQKLEHKLSQLYGDDTEFMLEGDRKSFGTCIEVINRFGKRSGLFMTNGKTCVIWLGVGTWKQEQFIDKIHETSWDGMELESTKV